MRDRATIHKQIQSVLSNPEDGLYKSLSCKTAILRILKTNDRFFNAEGLALKQTCIKLKKYKNLVVPKSKMDVRI